jgi:hypothetical protein
MKTYKVGLTRTYLISIKAENEGRAERLSEFYLGDCTDQSTKKDRLENKFLVEDIELVYNEAKKII